MAKQSVRWLSDEEQCAWRTFLDAYRLLYDRLDHELQRDAGLSHADYSVLVGLSEAPGRTLRMSELADQTLFSRSRLSHAVARLEELGWVERRNCPSDKRGTFAELTDKGFAALEAAAPGHVEGVRRYVFDGLTPAEVPELKRLMNTIRDRLTADQ